MFDVVLSSVLALSEFSKGQQLSTLEQWKGVCGGVIRTKNDAKLYVRVLWR